MAETASSGSLLISEIKQELYLFTPSGLHCSDQCSRSLTSANISQVSIIQSFDLNQTQGKV